MEGRLPDWTQLPPPPPLLQACIVMPVRNEAPRLRAALAALAAQRTRAGVLLDRSRFEIIVLANNCSDASAAVVRRFAARQPTLALHVVEVQFAAAVAHVGHARACLMDRACERLARTAGGAGVIVSTDGDTRVAPDWLAATLTEIAAGADAVGGRITTEPAAGDPPALLQQVRRDATYRRLRVRLESLLDPDAADPWPRHHQHFGASLAVRVDAYRRVGGCPAERFLEDEALFRKLRAHDLAVRHSDKVRVVTSGRRRGRVEVGLSQQLREWATLAARRDVVHVPDPQAWAATIALRRRLRVLWQVRQQNLAQSPGHGARAAEAAPELRSVARLLLRRNAAPAWLQAAWTGATSFGALWAQVEPALQQQRAPTLPIQLALTRLRALLAQHAAVG